MINKNNNNLITLERERERLEISVIYTINYQNYLLMKSNH